MVKEMWLDRKDKETKVWAYQTFEESDYLLWHTNWIFVRNNTQINMEYHIPMQDKELIGIER